LLVSANFITSSLLLVILWCDFLVVEKDIV
jgi:hypothetical protein